MTPMPTRGLWLDAHTHVALVEYAWLHRTQMSNVVRAILDHIVESPVDDSILSVTDRPGRKRLTLKSSDEQWNSARSVADAAGVGFNSLVRRHLIKALMEEGLLE